MLRMAIRRRRCAKCGQAHGHKPDEDFDPPKFCSRCRTERRANAVRQLKVGQFVHSEDGRYALPLAEAT